MIVTAFEQREATSPKSTDRQIDCLHGLRAMAALIVVLGHCNNVTAGSPFRLISWLSTLCVPVFICLSGYLLALPVVDTCKLKHGPLQFLEARANRIIPAFIAAMFLSIAIGCLITHTTHYTVFATPQFWQTLFLVTDFGIGAPGYDTPLWSLPVEFHIYFTFPILVWAWRKYGVLRATSVACGIAILSWNWLETSYAWSSPYLYAVFYMGAMAAWIAVSQRPRIVAMRTAIPWPAVSTAAMVLLLAHVQADGNRFLTSVLPDYLLCGAVTSIGLITLSLPGPNRVRMFLESSIMVKIGTISYSLYLIHFPLIDIFCPIVASWNMSPMFAYIALVLIELPTALLLASVMYGLFERPYLRQKERRAQSQSIRVNCEMPQLSRS